MTFRLKKEKMFASFEKRYIHPPGDGHNQPYDCVFC